MVLKHLLSKKKGHEWYLKCSTCKKHQTVTSDSNNDTRYITIKQLAIELARLGWVGTPTNRTYCPKCMVKRHKSKESK